MLGNSRGQSRVGTLIYLFAAVLVFYVVVKVVPVYMHYYAMDDEAYHQIEMSKINDVVTIRNDLVAKADELGIPVDPEDIRLTFDEEGRLNIFMYWVDEVDFGYGITRDFQFEIDTAAGRSEQ